MSIQPQIKIDSYYCLPGRNEPFPSQINLNNEQVIAEHSKRIDVMVKQIKKRDYRYSLLPGSRWMLPPIIASKNGI